jgi:valyl-tRNA synthetase
MTETEIYELWEKSGFFNPDKLPRRNKKPFTIIMPPPNANGALHIGHALFVTLQDLMIRFYRMTGRKTLWLPGADHAGFETQVVFDKKLEKEGRNRFLLPRDELWREMFAFTQENKARMENQMRRLGASCDWSREKFTLDPDIIEKTQQAFVELHREGLIYRHKRIVNWCVRHQTTLSDLELKHETRIDPLYYIAYGPLSVATVRPETIFGDTALAVNPEDRRYKEYVGREVKIKTLLGEKTLPVIADESVDPSFGTGVVKVTPAHDPADFEIAERHRLESLTVIDRFGRLNEKTGPYQGLKTKEAREKVAADLEKTGLLIKIDPNYQHNVAVCYKCGTPIEPTLLPQWFMKMKPLAKPAIEAVKKGRIEFIPRHFEKTYFHWLENIEDWNLSRQIIWGIRIPAWFCGKCGEINVSLKKPDCCPKCRSTEIEQDPDVLDTWFSSGQWPFLSLGYPDSRDYRTFYPTTVMETAYDILFFWVARMIMFGLKRTGRAPFRYVYLHGLLRDENRQKMSKSKGNVIDPLVVSEKYGTDALRMALIIGIAPGTDPVLSEDKIRGYRNFATKVRNAAKYVLMNYDENLSGPAKLSKDDRKNLRELDKIKKQARRDIESFRFHEAGYALYHYFWHTFADRIIEEAKPRIKSEDESSRKAGQETLMTILVACLKMLHPFIPFTTEEIYQTLPERWRKEKTLLIETW